MQYLCDVIGDQNHPKRVGWFRSFLTFIWCQINPATNIDIFMSDHHVYVGLTLGGCLVKHILPVMTLNNYGFLIEITPFDGILLI